MYDLVECTISLTLFYELFLMLKAQTPARCKALNVYIVPIGTYIESG